MRLTLILALLLLWTPLLHAETGRSPDTPARAVVDAEEAPLPQLAPHSVPTEEPLLAPHQQKVELPAQQAAITQPTRGSFWWVVIAVIVGGVILAAAGVF